MADEQTAGQDPRVPRTTLAGAGGSTQAPSLGRIVHFRDGNGGLDHAAIITRVFDSGAVGLHVFRDDALAGPVAAQQQIDPSDETAIGWFWPPRV